MRHSLRDIHLPSNDLILVAISGGPDSTALLHALHSRGYKLHAVHLDHGLRPEAADDAAYVQQLCESLAIPYTLGTADVAAEKKRRGGSVQEVARAVRYEFLEKTADEVGADVIATAHNQDDRIETVLLNIIRGTGTDGLRGIPYRRGRIIRPMLDVSRAEVEEYCREHGLTPRQDASNLSTKYSRNEIRLNLIPYLEERFNSNVGAAILRLSEIAADESDYLNETASNWLGRTHELNAMSLSKLAVALQRRVLQLWLKNQCGVTDGAFEHIEAVRRSISTKATVTLPGNVRVAQKNGYIVREEPNQRELVGQELDVPITVPSQLEYLGWRVVADGSIPAGMRVSIRLHRSGDRMRFDGGRKKLSDLFCEEKVPLFDRETAPVLVDDRSGEVLAAAVLHRVSVTTPDLRLTAERITPI